MIYLHYLSWGNCDSSVGRASDLLFLCEIAVASFIINEAKLGQQFKLKTLLRLNIQIEDTS